MKQNDILLDTLYQSMITYYQNDLARIQHFVKVHSFARLIGRLEGMDEEALLTLEADFLVNLFEDKSPADAAEKAYERIFRTKSGKEICRTMFGIERKGESFEEDCNC